MRSKRKVWLDGKIRLGDWVVMGTVLLFAAVITFATAHHSSYQQVYVKIWQEIDGERKIIYSGQLLDNTSKTIQAGDHNTVILEGKTARMAFADCPDQVCVRIGTLTQPGQAAVCLPNRVVVELTGRKHEIDAVAS